jgi:hypothetical protein
MVGIQRGVIRELSVITTFNDVFSVILQILPDGVARKSPESPVNPRYHRSLEDFLADPAIDRQRH